MTKTAVLLFIDYCNVTQTTVFFRGRSLFVFWAAGVLVWWMVEMKDSHVYHLITSVKPLHESAFSDSKRVCLVFRSFCFSETRRINQSFCFFTTSQLWAAPPFPLCVALWENSVHSEIRVFYSACWLMWVNLILSLLLLFTLCSV